MIPSPNAVVGGNVKGDGERGPGTVTPRSPYSADRAPLGGNASALTRPYLSALDIWLPEATG